MIILSVKKIIYYSYGTKILIFSAGFSHKDNPTSIDLNVVRLCFQAFLGGSQKGKYSILEPVVSDPIYDKSEFSWYRIIK